MDERQTIAVSDTDGNLLWFAVKNSERWCSTTLEADELFRISGRWVLLDATANLLGKPARTIDDEAALSWFVVNGFLPPDELVNFAKCSELS
jgi:hypothetical protein